MNDHFLIILRKNNGLTLIELIVAMVVISIAFSGVLLIMNYATSHSADPVLQRQALAIAESYLEEIMLKEVTDPDGVGEGSRALYDDVSDYDGLDDNGAKDQLGNAISGLSNYQVKVVVNEVASGLGPTESKVDTWQITVRVIDPAQESFSLTGYRCDY